MLRPAEQDYDDIDMRIINALSRDARIAFSRLAQELDVSNTLIHQRIRKLKDSGLLKESVFKLDAQMLGYDTSAYCQIMLENPRHLRKVIEELEEIPEVVECVNVSGRYAIMVKLYARNNSHLRDIIYDRIEAIEGVDETNTVVNFETSFDRAVPVPLSSMEKKSENE